MSTATEQDVSAPKTAEPAALPRSRYALFFCIVVAGCLIDLATKSWMFEHLGMPDRAESIWLIDQIFGFQTSLNEGALFGMGQGWGALFILLSVAAMVGIVAWLFYFRAAHDRWLTVALAFVMGGTLGNLYDRLGMPGLTWTYPMGRVGEPVYAVRDWIYFKAIEWPVFNLADSFLVCGAIMLGIHAFFPPSPPKDEDN